MKHACVALLAALLTVPIVGCRAEVDTDPDSRHTRTVKTVERDRDGDTTIREERRIER